MGKVDFQSHKVELSVSVEKAYAFLYDLNNLHQLMPEQVINWQSTEDTCSFDIKGMAHISLKRGEIIQNRQVSIVSLPENPIELEIRGIMERTSDNLSSATVELTADLSPMLQLMVSGPLQNLVNIMADRLKGAQF